MMKLSIRLTLPLFILSAVVTAFAPLAGRGIDTDAATAFVGTLYRNPIALFDFHRRLRTDYFLPAEGEYSANLIFGSHHVFFVTSSQSPQTRLYKHGIYRHTLVSGETIPVYEAESSRPFNASPNTYAISSSADKIAFFDPLDSTLYILHIGTGAKFSLGVLEHRQVTGFMAWSPDETMLAVNARNLGENLLYIYNADGSAPRTYDFDRIDFYPAWTQDSRYVVLQNADAEGNGFIDFIRADDGTEHPLTVGLRGINLTWQSCDSLWITYVVNRGFREGFILNLDTGEKIRVNDHPLLKRESIDSIIPSRDCESFFISAYAGLLTDLLPPAHPLYVWQNGEVQLIDDQVIFWEQEADNTFYYEKQDANWTYGYRQNLNPLGEPVLVTEYESVNGRLRWTEDRALATYTEQPPVSFGRQTRPSRGRLTLFFPDTGQKLYLTESTETLFYYDQYRWSSR
jgi:hypothetical protein